MANIDADFSGVFQHDYTRDFAKLRLPNIIKDEAWQRLVRI